MAIDANERGGLGSLLDEMHQVRARGCARMFAGRLGWQVQIEEGRERDGYPPGYCSDLRRLKRVAA